MGNQKPRDEKTGLDGARKDPWCFVSNLRQWLPPEGSSVKKRRSHKTIRRIRNDGIKLCDGEGEFYGGKGS